MLANYYERYLDSHGDFASFVTLGATDALKGRENRRGRFHERCFPQWRCSKSEGGYRLGVWEEVCCCVGADGARA